MLIAHLHIPLNQHIRIEQVLRALNIILALILHKGGVDVRVNAQLQILTLVCLLLTLK